MLHARSARLLLGVPCAAWLLLGPLAMADDVDTEAIRRAVTLYASFDEAVRADFGGGCLLPSTRFDHATEKGAFEFVPSIDSSIFQIAKGGGVRGGALKATDVLPRRGRIFFPAKGNLAYRPGGWGGSVSMWLATDPNTMLKTSFCDPIQITEKGANNGGLWCDFPDVRPRDFRLGAFPGVADGEQPLSESAPDAPLVVVKKIGFQADNWHHVAMTWNHFDTGKPNAVATLWIDGRPAGQLTERQLAMNWNLDRTGIYFAVSYIGLMDELAVFDRPLSAAEIAYLHAHPAFEFRPQPATAQVHWKPRPDFFQVPEGLPLGACSAVAVNAQGEVFAFHRGKQPILVFDSRGKHLRSFGEGVIDSAHGLRIDAEDNVWVTDIGSHSVHKFDRQGKLLLTLGTGKPGTGNDQFNRPTDIAFGREGEVFITDGYGNSRVQVFTPGGRWLRGWGTKGTGRGEFHLPHAMLIDGRGRVLVGDRENDRIQIFDQDGALLDMWEGFAPFGLALNPQGELFVADGRANRFPRTRTGARVVHGPSRSSRRERRRSP